MVVSAERVRSKILLFVSLFVTRHPSSSATLTVYVIDRLMSQYSEKLIYVFLSCAQLLHPGAKLSPHQQIIDRLPCLETCVLNLKPEEKTVVVQLPVAAYTALIRKYSIIKDVVVDLSPGCGAFLEAALINNRQSIGVFGANPTQQAGLAFTQKRIMLTKGRPKLCANLAEPPTEAEIQADMNRLPPASHVEDTDDDDEGIFGSDDLKILELARSSTPPFLCPPGFRNSPTDQDFLSQTQTELGLKVKKSQLKNAGKGCVCFPSMSL
jgi:hypothetical protein